MNENKSLPTVPRAAALLVPGDVFADGATITHKGRTYLSHGIPHCIFTTDQGVRRINMAGTQQMRG